MYCIYSLNSAVNCKLYPIPYLNKRLCSIDRPEYITLTETNFRLFDLYVPTIINNSSNYNNLF